MGNTIKQNSFKEFYEQTSFGIADKTIKEQWHKNKKIIKIDLAVTGTLSLLAAGYVYTIFIGLEKPFFPRTMEQEKRSCLTGTNRKIKIQTGKRTLKIFRNKRYQ